MATPMIPTTAIKRWDWLPNLWDFRPGLELAILKLRRHSHPNVASRAGVRYEEKMPSGSCGRTDSFDHTENVLRAKATAHTTSTRYTLHSTSANQTVQQLTQLATHRFCSPLHSLLHILQISIHPSIHPSTIYLNLL